MVDFLFFCCAGMVLLSSMAVVTASSVVYSVLSLILTFFLSSSLFVMLGAELIAMLLVIVYVGAVAVLFLFVVMMLDMNRIKSRHGLVKYYPLGILCGVLFLGCITYSILLTKANFAPDFAGSSTENIFLIGSRLYTEYFYVFQMSGVLLLVAAVGALVLTVRGSTASSFRQDVTEQLNRSSKVRLVSPKVGGGVEEVQ